jgi:hypothetical protein
MGYYGADGQVYCGQACAETAILLCSTPGCNNLPCEKGQGYCEACNAIRNPPDTVLCSVPKCDRRATHECQAGVYCKACFEKRQASGQTAEAAVAPISPGAIRTATVGSQDNGIASVFPSSGAQESHCLAPPTIFPYRNSSQIYELVGAMTVQPTWENVQQMSVSGVYGHGIVQDFKGAVITEQVTMEPKSMLQMGTDQMVTQQMITGPTITGSMVTGPAITEPTTGGPMITGSAITGPMTMESRSDGPLIVDPAVMESRSFRRMAVGPIVTRQVPAGLMATGPSYGNASLDFGKASMITDPPLRKTSQIHYMPEISDNGLLQCCEGPRIGNHRRQMVEVRKSPTFAEGWGTTSQTLYKGSMFSTQDARPSQRSESLAFGDDFACVSPLEDSHRRTMVATSYKQTAQFHREESPFFSPRSGNVLSPYVRDLTLGTTQQQMRIELVSEQVSTAFSDVSDIGAHGSAEVNLSAQINACTQARQAYEAAANYAWNRMYDLEAQRIVHAAFAAYETALAAVSGN